jgi:Spy/CpxP family protein refolding chaperone
MIKQSLAGLALAAAFLLPAGAFAQTTAGAAPAGGMSAAAASKMTPDNIKAALESCDLTFGQKRKIQPMVQNYKSQSANADAATKQQDGVALLKGIMGVLTPAQQTQFKTALMK